ncbi:hypothetical protein PROFUN_05525 [Planoprotostelium fungivorum]|uniref:Uncharacterized protein n=1 Tax=Planoprotostelium fungivorum TaxID=1890364 RepID=A0A2P6NR04_9EUKA|nr:hypothetical protein PROFUN_05525 [Planoprotostelium fungivorum]
MSEGSVVQQVEPSSQSQLPTSDTNDATWRIEIPITNEGPLIVDWERAIQGESEAEDGIEPENAFDEVIESNETNTEESLNDSEEEDGDASDIAIQILRKGRNRMADLIERTMRNAATREYKAHGDSDDEKFIDDSDLVDESQPHFDENYGEFFVHERDENDQRGKSAVKRRPAKMTEPSDTDFEKTPVVKKRKIEKKEEKKVKSEKKDAKEKKEKNGTKEKKEAKEKKEEKQKKKEEKQQKEEKQKKEKEEKEEDEDEDQGEKKKILKRIQQKEGVDEKEARKRLKDMCKESAKDTEIRKLLDALRTVFTTGENSGKFPDRAFYQVCMHSTQKFGLLTKPILEELVSVFKNQYKLNSLRSKYTKFHRCDRLIEEMKKKMDEKKKEIAKLNSDHPINPRTMAHVVVVSEVRNKLETLVTEYFDLVIAHYKQVHLKHSICPEEGQPFANRTPTHLLTLAAQQLSDVWSVTDQSMINALVEVYKTGKNKAKQETEKEKKKEEKKEEKSVGSVKPLSERRKTPVTSIPSPLPIVLNP